MSTKRQRLRAASCLYKATYRTKTDALAAVSRYHARVPLMENALNAYQCRFGQHWHVGHSNQRTMVRTMIKEFMEEISRGLIAGEH